MLHEESCQLIGAALATLTSCSQAASLHVLKLEFSRWQSENSGDLIAGNYQ